MTTTERVKPGAPAAEDELVTVFGGGWLDAPADDVVTVDAGGALDDEVWFYSEDQPRDEHGRWTSDGGGGDSAGEWREEKGGYVFYKKDGTPETGTVRTAGQRDASIALRQKAMEMEPVVTKVLQDVAARSGAELDRFEFRLKTNDSIARKAGNYAKELKISEKEVVEQNKVQDYLRYTLVEPSVDDYIGTVQSVSDDLKEAGISLVVDNFWVPGDAYNGINAQGTDAQGRTFEVQFHTRDSLRIAEENHPDYEYVRVMTNPKEERRARFERMRAKADAQPFPKDSLAIGRPRLKEFKEE